MLDPLYRALGGVLSFFYDLIPNYGVAIILLTIFVRILLLPLTIKQTKSMQKLQKIGPQMKGLQAKFKNDKQRLNEEMIKLYKEHQVNPFGGCLPLLLQFPVFIALFQVLNACGDPAIRKGRACAAEWIGTKHLAQSSALFAAIQSGNTHFLGMSMAQTPRAALGDGILTALPYLVLLVLMGLTTWYQTKQAQAAQPPGAGAAQMAIMGKVMPVMLMFFSFGFPAGVSIYWVVSNFWTIGQQRALLGAVRKEPDATPPKGSGGGGGTPKGGGPKKGPAADAETARPKGRPAAGQASAKGPKPKAAPARKGASAAKDGRSGSAKSPGSRNGGDGVSGDRPPPATGGRESPPSAAGAAEGGGKAAGGGAGNGAGGPARSKPAAQRPPGAQQRKKRRR